ncbi:hypothetical protein [Streptomyces sp. PBH53]|uniref:hypothetical protein n=1 Tax=Streptomyces sp. PBH53 TaxID=1577075 RepID=UPI0021C4A56B|nr:hypothetical protein [Streptomyces sp. PBH53]
MFTAHILRAHAECGDQPSTPPASPDFGEHLCPGGRRLDGIARLRHIEARHPARRGAKSPMQTLRIETPSPDGAADDADGARTTGPGAGQGAGPGRGLSPLLAGAATAVAAAGALLALTDTATPLRGPCTLFFLLMAPAAAIAAALRGLRPFGRAVTALAGAVVVDMLVAQTMLAVHRWSVRGGVVAVAALSALILLAAAPVALHQARISKNRPQE